ncbi:MAG: molybdenum cofactor biosynthesis protein MoaE [Anaerolineales bacterium]|nr:molybdenum cofactor biosynthesis protein MoaE [Anaerolineales bacterium]
MQITVLFFATLKDRAGAGRLALELPDGATVAELKACLAAMTPGLAPALPTALVSVNHEFAFAADVLPDDAEVALFPPVSGGGMDAPAGFPTILRITHDALDLDDLVAAITLPSTGAACVFTGMVRGQTRRASDPLGPHTTVRLEYEAYQPMAEAKLQQVADEIRARWPAVEGIAAVQRIGPLAPGTPTVLIACSAAHRDTGVFEAARYGIDRLKEIVPVWKKEIGPNGDVWVEGRFQPGEADRAQENARGAPRESVTPAERPEALDNG